MTFQGHTIISTGRLDFLSETGTEGYIYFQTEIAETTIVTGDGTIHTSRGL